MGAGLGRESWGWLSLAQEWVLSISLQGTIGQTAVLPPCSLSSPLSPMHRDSYIFQHQRESLSRAAPAKPRKGRWASAREIVGKYEGSPGTGSKAWVCCVLPLSSSLFCCSVRTDGAPSYKGNSLEGVLFQLWAQAQASWLDPALELPWHCRSHWSVLTDCTA